MLSWFGHVHRITNDGVVKTLREWKLLSAGLAGRPKIGWEKDIKEDLGIVKINNWTKCNQDRLKWKKLFQKAETFKQGSCSA